VGTPRFSETRARLPAFVSPRFVPARARGTRTHSKLTQSTSPGKRVNFVSSSLAMQYPPVGTAPRAAPNVGWTPNTRSPLGTTPGRGYAPSGVSTPIPAVDVADAVFAEIRNSGSDTTAPELTDRHLEILLFVFDEKHLSNALVLVQTQKVKRLVAETSLRTCFQVQGRTVKENYLCYPNTYCSCRAFQWDVISRGEHVACKHQLAVKIAAATNAFASSTISDLLMAQLLEAYTRNGGGNK
jgi:predicted nucleic acid-binding Zn finger protein